MKIKYGCTRLVILCGKYAFKFPQVCYQWRHFLLGLLGNMQEIHMSTLKDDRMCPVRFSIAGGWLVVMPRCKELSQDDFFGMDFTDFQSGDFQVPVENKLDSFGWYQNRIVALDYGS